MATENRISGIRGFHRFLVRSGHYVAAYGGLAVIALASALALAKPWLASHLGAELTRILVFVLLLSPPLALLFYAYAKTVRQERRINWLTNATQWNINQLHAHGLQAEPQGKSKEADTAVTAWPWGNHHTEMLGHLDAAARKWWANYDPDSPDTAPTNDMVSDWLYNERDISKDKAKAIASILRADGLRTGPRR